MVPNRFSGPTQFAQEAQQLLVLSEGAGRLADYVLIDRPGAVVRFVVVYKPEVSNHYPPMLQTL